MRRRELARYHDVAASTKTQGEGIGFAGVGIKMALLVCGEVLTETRQRDKHVATAWALASRHRAPWKWVPPLGLVAERGTAVRLTLDNALSPLLDPGFIETTLRRHFQPLFDPAFDAILGEHYPAGVEFRLNGERLCRRAAGRRRCGPDQREAHAPSQALGGGLPDPRARARARGSPWAGGQHAGQGHQARLGLDRSHPRRPRARRRADRGAAARRVPHPQQERLHPLGRRAARPISAYRKAIQEAVSRQLAEWGDAAEAGERERRRAARPVERDLESVLMDLAESFPLLATLVEQRAGGQQRLPMAKSGKGLVSGTEWAAGAPLGASPAAEPPPAPSGASGLSEGDVPGAGISPAPESAPESAPEGEPAPASAPGSAPAHLPAERGPRRPGRYGLNIQFEARPGDPELARLVESTVWVNEAHPAYRRAAASRSEGYHIALASALALAPLAVEPAREHAFVTAFLESWGSALGRVKSTSRKPRRR